MDVHIDEVSRWLTLERIGLSDFMKFAMFDNRECWAGHDLAATAEWLFSVIRTFCCGECFSLASAVSLHTAFPIAIIRRRLDTTDSIVHALVLDPKTGEGADILGRRPMAAVLSEFKVVVGDVYVSLLSAGYGVDDDEEAEELARIGAALPWMPSSARWPKTSFAEFQILIERRARRRATSSTVC